MEADKLYISLVLIVHTINFQCFMSLGYQTAYSQLVFAGKKDVDPCSAVPDAKLFLAKHLEKLSVGQPGKVSKTFRVHTGYYTKRHETLSVGQPGKVSKISGFTQYKTP